MLVGILAATTTPTVYDLTPLVLIVIFIIAAAGLTKGGDIFQFFGVASLIGVTGGIGGGAGKGLRSANPSTRVKATPFRPVGAGFAVLGSKAAKAGMKSASNARAAKQAAILDMSTARSGTGAVAAGAGVKLAVAGAAGAAVGVGLGSRMATNNDSWQSRRTRASGRRYETARQRAANFDSKVDAQKLRYANAEKNFKESRGLGKARAGAVLLGSKFRTRAVHKGLPVLRSDTVRGTILGVPMLLGSQRAKNWNTQWQGSERLHAKADRRWSSRGILGTGIYAGIQHNSSKLAKRQLEAEKPGSTSASSLREFALQQAGGPAVMVRLARDPREARSHGMSDSNIRRLQHALKKGEDHIEFRKAAERAAYQSRYNPVDSSAPLRVSASQRLLGPGTAAALEQRRKEGRGVLEARRHYKEARVESKNAHRALIDAQRMQRAGVEGSREYAGSAKGRLSDALAAEETAKQRYGRATAERWQKSRDRHDEYWSKLTIYGKGNKQNDTRQRIGSMQDMREEREDRHNHYLAGLQGGAAGRMPPPHMNKPHKSPKPEEERNEDVRRSQEAERKQRKEEREKEDEAKKGDK